MESWDPEGESLNLDISCLGETFFPKELDC